MLAGPLVFLGILAATPLPVRLPSDVADAYSVRANPGGLGLVRGRDVRLLYGRHAPDDGRTTDGLGLFTAFSLFDVVTVAGGLELDVVPGGRTDERLSLGVGAGSEQTGFGLAIEHASFASGPSVNVLSAGLETRLASFLSAGLAVHDVAQNEGHRRYDLGVSLRPGTDRVTLSTRWRLTQGTRAFGDASDFLFRVEGEPLLGVKLGLGARWLRDAGESDLRVLASAGVSFGSLGLSTSVEDLPGSFDVATDVAWQSRARPSVFAPSRIAVVALEGDLVPDPSFDLWSQSFRSSAYGGVPLLLDALARSDLAAGVFLRVAHLSIGWAKAEELRALVAALRASGLRVDCELAASGDLEYFVASACSSIFMAPGLALEVNGLASNALFFSEALEKIGIKVEVVARGAYKSAPEQFTRSGMSPAQREALGAYLDTVYGSFLDGVSSARGISRAELERVLARGTLTATEAVAAKLVDAVLYPDELEGELRKLYDAPVSLAKATSLLPPSPDRWGTIPQIAVVHIEGPITGGSSKTVPFGLGNSAGAETIIQALERARLDSRVVAVVLRVDSPGGDALASDMIARAVRLLGEAKPVIASFGDAAASGGYYVAAGARAIYAEPTTLTGSIGVFALKPSAESLLKKLGVGVDALSRGPVANGSTLYHDWTPEERAVVERQIDFAYRQFLDVVAKGRKLENVRSVAEGRIWSGKTAKELGLVDAMGGLTEALARARGEAGLADGASVEVVSSPGLSEAISVSAARALGVRAKLFDAAWVRLLPQAMTRALWALTEEDGASEGRPLAFLPLVLHID